MGTDETWVDAYRTEHECDEHWELRRSFLLAHKDRFPEDQLVCLAQVFTNVEFLGCRYPDKTMQLVAELSKDVAAGYREKQKTRLQRTFVKASDAAGAKAKGLKRPQDQPEQASSNAAAPPNSSSTRKPGCTPPKTIKYNTFVAESSESPKSEPPKESSESIPLETKTEESNSFPQESSNLVPEKQLPQNTPAPSQWLASTLQKELPPSKLAKTVKFTKFVSAVKETPDDSAPNKDLAGSGPGKPINDSNFAPVSQASNSSSIKPSPSMLLPTSFSGARPSSGSQLEAEPPPTTASFFERRVSNGNTNAIPSTSVSERSFTTTSGAVQPLNFSQYGGVRTYHIDRPTSNVDENEIEEVEEDPLDKEPPILPPSKVDVDTAFNAINSSPYGRLVLVQMSEHDENPSQIIHRSTVGCQIASNYVYENLPGGKTSLPRRPPPDVGWRFYS